MYSTQPPQYREPRSSHEYRTLDYAYNVTDQEKLGGMIAAHPSVSNTPMMMPNATPNHGRLPVYSPYSRADHQETHHSSMAPGVFYQSAYATPYHYGEQGPPMTQEGQTVSVASPTQPYAYISAAATIAQHPSKPLPVEPPTHPLKNLPCEPQNYNLQYGYTPSAGVTVHHDSHPYYNEYNYQSEIPPEYQSTGSDNDTSSSSAALSQSGSQHEDGKESIRSNAKKESPCEDKNATRQITVRSINQDYVLWITIDPTETGVSLAQKIRTIATFGTCKILSITTAAGRQVPIDHRPVFGSWMDTDGFEHGERWKVEWCSVDRSMLDKFLSKVFKILFGRRHRSRNN